MATTAAAEPATETEPRDGLSRLVSPDPAGGAALQYTAYTCAAHHNRCPQPLFRQTRAGRNEVGGGDPLPGSSWILLGAELLSLSKRGCPRVLRQPERRHHP